VSKCNYPTLHLDKIKVKKQLVVRKDMDVHEHVKLSNIILRYKLKVKEQLVVRKDMDVHEHVKLSNIIHNAM
jgi:hypothetical protein